MQRVKTIKSPVGKSLVLQWLGLYGSTAGGTELIPGQETKIPSCPVAQLKNKKAKQNRTLSYWFHI